MNYHRGYFQITVTYSLGGKRQVLSLETKSFPSYDSMLMESYLKNHNKFKNNDIALKLAQFVVDIVFYIHAKFQRKIIICKIVMIFFLTAQKLSLDWWGRFRPQGRMEGREKKEKKGGDEGSNGFKLPFPLASSFHSSLGPKCPPSVQRNFFDLLEKKS